MPDLKGANLIRCACGREVEFTRYWEYLEAPNPRGSGSHRVRRLILSTPEKGAIVALEVGGGIVAVCPLCARARGLLKD